MATAPDQREPRAHLPGLSLPEDDRRVRAHHPRAVSGVQVDRRVEDARPLDHGGVIVGVRDGDGGNPAHTADRRDRRLVEQADAIPEHVAARRPHQERPLADGKARFRPDAQQPRVLFLDHGAVTPP